MKVAVGIDVAHKSRKENDKSERSHRKAKPEQ